MGAPAASATATVRAGSVGLYRPRRPRASPLYRLLEDHFAEFSTVYDERFAHRYGYWRPVIAEVVEKYLACGILDTASPACAVVRARTSICSRSRASAAPSARVATRSVWRCGVCGWRRACSRTYHTGRWCSRYQSGSGRTCSTTAPAGLPVVTTPERGPWSDSRSKIADSN